MLRIFAEGRGLAAGPSSDPVHRLRITLDQEVGAKPLKAQIAGRIREDIDELRGEARRNKDAKEYLQKLEAELRKRGIEY